VHPATEGWSQGEVAKAAADSQDEAKRRPAHISDGRTLYVLGCGTAISCHMPCYSTLLISVQVPVGGLFIYRLSYVEQDLSVFFY
jgi:hypothetical protein